MAFQPAATMRLEISAPCLWSLNRKRQYFTGERRRKPRAPRTSGNPGRPRTSRRHRTGTRRTRSCLAAGACGVNSHAPQLCIVYRGSLRKCTGSRANLNGPRRPRRMAPLLSSSISWMTLMSSSVESKSFMAFSIRLTSFWARRPFPGVITLGQPGEPTASNFHGIAYRCHGKRVGIVLWGGQGGHPGPPELAALAVAVRVELVEDALLHRHLGLLITPAQPRGRGVGNFR